MSGRATGSRTPELEGLCHQGLRSSIQTVLALTICRHQHRACGQAVLRKLEGAIGGCALRLRARPAARDRRWQRLMQPKQQPMDLRLAGYHCQATVTGGCGPGSRTTSAVSRGSATTGGFEHQHECISCGCTGEGAPDIFCHQLCLRTCRHLVLPCILTFQYGARHMMLAVARYGGQGTFMPAVPAGVAYLGSRAPAWLVTLLWCPSPGHYKS